MLSTIDPAQEQIRAFEERFTSAHLDFACHAALPLAVTPDLLYHLWGNFNCDRHNRSLNIPWVAVSDLLLSGLCEEVGHELYEMKREVREALLDRLKNDERFGEERLKRVARLLLVYVQKDLPDLYLDDQEFKESQAWTAWAYLKPEKTVAALAAEFERAYQENPADLMRLVALTEVLHQPMEEFDRLRIFARAMGHFCRKRFEDCRGEFLKLTVKNNQVYLGNRIRLKVPPELLTMIEPTEETKVFPELTIYYYEIITLNQDGEIAQRQKGQNQGYFEKTNVFQKEGIWINDKNDYELPWSPPKRTTLEQKFSTFLLFDYLHRSVSRWKSEKQLLKHYHFLSTTNPDWDAIDWLKNFVDCITSETVPLSEQKLALYHLWCFYQEDFYYLSRKWYMSQKLPRHLFSWQEIFDVVCEPLMDLKKAQKSLKQFKSHYSYRKYIIQLLYHRSRDVFHRKSRLEIYSLEEIDVQFQQKQEDEDILELDFEDPLSEDILEVNIAMVMIPAGEFIMGSPKNETERFSDEDPQHPVKISRFWMSRTVITQQQWKIVAQLPPVVRSLDPDPSYFKGENNPVECVSWEDCMEFCLRLSQATGKTYRLPSEAEWEYACRAGTTTPFHFGPTLSPQVANYNGDYTYGRGKKGEYRQKTIPVGSLNAPNAWGLQDMHGNVHEWCLDDWHDSYECAPTDGRAWINNDFRNDKDYLKSLLSSKLKLSKLVRGGSWKYDPGNCRSAIRMNLTYNGKNNYIGFRVVCPGTP
ncbi:formylglycine-generating enzyme family protein [Spirulina sp. CCNP1310]|uniref:formylglycine-generating enzyme family protein n=1 Tax=Spirulina sp. CCNP1310 TaxID=3110249 RepID=UPI002B1F41CC|nr:formylglycine-generating enzyme family protein [Spirulina sp. CCNP1310]MEA5421147.1 formylglycine-generating enzyme family protein [Spirulina sp. CCNP1310]